MNIAHRLFNVDEYERMTTAGILAADERVELISGEIVQMSRIGSVHAGLVNQLSVLLNRQAAERALLAVQNPMRLSEYTEAQPDLMLLRPHADFYKRAFPGAQDVLLIIEVSDTTLAFDQNVKTTLYACALIAEVWIIDVLHTAIIQHSQPNQDAYQKVETINRSANINAITLAGVTISVADLLDT